MKTQAFSWDEAHRQFPGMEADVHLGIYSVQVVEHPHVQIEVVHWHVPVFRHHQIQSDYTWIGGSELKAGENLREHLFRRKPAQYLVKITNRHVAGGKG